MLFGSGPESFKRNGTHIREKYYYSLFKKNQLLPKLIEYPINRKEHKGLLKFVQIIFQLLNSISHPIFDNKKFRDFDLIRCKQIYGAWSGLILKIVKKRKLIIRVGYSWSQSILYESGSKSLKFKISKIFEQFILKNSDGIIVTSKYLFKKYKYLKKEIVVIPNGVNIENFKDLDIKTKYDYIYVGRLIHIKGIDRILDFVLSNKNKSFLIIGSNPNNININKFGNIHYIEKVANDQLPILMNKSRRIINLSRSEGSPKALIEGIACGCFPVVSNINAHENILSDLKYGTIVEYPKKSFFEIGKFNNRKYESFRNKYSLKNCVKKESDFMKRIYNN